MKTAMKKLLCSLLLVLLCLPALAAPVRVADNAHLLSDTDEARLLRRANEISEEYALDVVIATTGDSRGMTLGHYAADLIDNNAFRTDNIILVVAMDQRRYVCVTTGRGITAFTDYTLDAIYDAMEDDMISGDYAAAFDTFLMLCERALRQEKSGHAYDYDLPMVTRPTGEILLTRLGLSLVPGVAIGWLIAYSRKKRMNSAVPQRSAENYMTDMRLTRSRDIYLYTTTVRRRIETNHSGGPHGGHGGSSTFRGSSGRSHGGGGGGRRF